MSRCHIGGDSTQLGSELTCCWSLHVHQGALKLLVDCHFLLLVRSRRVRRHRTVKRLLRVLVLILEIWVEVWFISSTKQVCLSIPIGQFFIILCEFLR